MLLPLRQCPVLPWQVLVVGDYTEHGGLYDAIVNSGHARLHAIGKVAISGERA